MGANKGNSANFGSTSGKQQTKARHGSKTGILECQCRTIPQTGCGKKLRPRGRCLAFHLGSPTSGSHLTGSLDLGKQRPVCPARMVRSHRVHGRQCWQSSHPNPPGIGVWAPWIQWFRRAYPRPMVDPSRRTHGRQSTWRHHFFNRGRAWPPRYPYRLEQCSTLAAA